MFVSFLRNSAATLITLSGIGHLAALWFRELSAAALLDALCGAVYLFIGIGLFGQSKFSLFLAMVLPAASAALVCHGAAPAGLDPAQTVRVVIDALVVLISMLVLWQIRHQPSI